MKLFLRTAAEVCALVALFGAQDMPVRWVEVSGVGLNVEKSCGRYEFAAAVQSLAAKAGVNVPQAALVERVYGSADCGPVGDPAAAASRASGSYSLDDGTRFRVSAAYSSGAGTADTVIVPLSKGRAYVAFWKKRPMVVVAAAFNRVNQAGQLVPFDDGNSYPVIQVIRMLDAKTGGTREWRRGTDNVGDLTGTMSVTIARQ